MKKGLIITIIVGIIAALSLGIYTIVEMNPSKPAYVPTHDSFNVAYRQGDVASDLQEYNLEDGNVTLTFDEGVEGENAPIVFDEQTGKFVAKNSGNATVVINKDNGDTITYKIVVVAHNPEGTSAEHPYVICNATHLREYAALTKTNTHALDMYVSLAGNIDLSGEDWAPIGNAANPFTGSFEGNGYTISNMRIVVNADTYINFISRHKNPNNDMDIGFFSKTVGANITNVNFDGASILVDDEVLNLIKTYAFDSIAELNGAVVGRINVGVVAGYMTRSTFTSTVAEKNVKVTNTVIRGFSYNAYPNGVTPSGIGSVAGSMAESKISNVEISSEIYADYLIAEGSRVGGVVGFITYFDPNAGFDAAEESHKATLDNIIVQATVATRYYLGDQNMSNDNYELDLCNAVGLISADVVNANILNVTVRNSKIVDYNGTYQKVNKTQLPEQYKLVLMSGGVAWASSVDNGVTNTLISNVNIDGVFANPAGRFGGVVGIADENTTYTDCYARVDVSGYSAGGFAYQIKEYATVIYTENFDKEYAVDAKIEAAIATAYTVYLNGTVQGYESAEHAKTTIKSEIVGYGSAIGNDKDKADLIVASGFAGYIASRVDGYVASAKNLTIITNINKSVNIVGIASMLGKTVMTANDGTEFDYYGALVDNILVVMEAKSYYNAGARLSTTKYVSAGVGQIYDASTINNVQATINLNNGINTAENYGAAIFGGIVGQVFGADSIITNNVISGNVTIVEGNFWTRTITGTENIYNIQVAGGLIGIIASEDYSDVMVNDLTVTGNTVSYLNMNVVGDFEYTTGEDNSDKILFRIRGVGALVGNINNTVADSDNVIDLSTNNLSNVVVSASYSAFDFTNIAKGNIVQIFVGCNGSSVVGCTCEYVDLLNATFVIEPQVEEGAVTYINSDVAA